MSAVTSAVSDLLGTALAVAAVMVTKVLARKFDQLTEDDDAPEDRGDDDADRDDRT